MSQQSKKKSQQQQQQQQHNEWMTYRLFYDSDYFLADQKTTVYDRLKAVTSEINRIHDELLSNEVVKWNGYHVNTVKITLS